MKTGKTKVKSVSVGGTWEKDGTTYYNHNYEMEDGQKIQASHKTEIPINVGEDVEWEVKRSSDKYGDSGSVKKPNDFKGGGRKIMMSFKDARRMSASNAIHAIGSVNSSYGEERIKSDAIDLFMAFTLGDIKVDVDKFGEDSSLFTSRLSALNNASAMSGYKSFKTASEVVELAEVLYNVIITK